MYPTETVPVNSSVTVPGFATTRMKADAFAEVPDSFPDSAWVQVNSGGPIGHTPSELLHGPAGVSDTLAGAFVDQTRLIDAEEVVERAITSGQETCPGMSGLSNDSRVVEAGPPEMTKRVKKRPPPITARAAPTTTSPVRTRDGRWTSQ